MPVQVSAFKLKKSLMFVPQLLPASPPLPPPHAQSAPGEKEEGRVFLMWGVLPQKNRLIPDVYHVDSDCCVARIKILKNELKVGGGRGKLADLFAEVIALGSGEFSGE